MAIEFQCMCGKKLTVSDDAAGRKAKCPSCGAVSNVPGTSEPETTEETPRESKVDQVVDRLSADFAESRERAPQLTQIAVALAILAAASLALQLIITMASASFSFAFWLLVWVPQAAAGGLIALGTIKADPRTPSLVDLVAPVIIGVNWGVFWLSAVPAGGKGAAVVTSLVTVVNLGAYVFLFWYFHRHDTRLLFPDEVEPAELAEEKSPPEGETEKK